MAAPQFTQTKTRVRRNPADRHWHVWCPCGFTWRTHSHRVALLMAVNHLHEAA